MGKRVVQLYLYRSVQWSTVTGGVQLYRDTIAHAYGSNTGISVKEFYRGSGVVKVYRSSKGIVQGFSGSTVFLGLCRGSRVVQVYTDTGVVQVYRNSTVRQRSRSCKRYSSSAGTGVVQSYRCNTVVLVLCRSTNVVQGYRGSGVVEACMGTRVVQVYRNSTGLQGSRSSIGIQEQYRGSTGVQ